MESLIKLLGLKHKITGLPNVTLLFHTLKSWHRVGCSPVPIVRPITIGLMLLIHLLNIRISLMFYFPLHCVKIVQIRSFFLVRVQSKFGKIRTWKKSVFGHFLRSACLIFQFVTKAESKFDPWKISQASILVPVLFNVYMGQSIQEWTK